MEAVIISGNRKGEFITVGSDKADSWEMTPAGEALLDRLVSDAQRMADNARAAAMEADGLLQDLRQARRHQP